MDHYVPADVLQLEIAARQQEVVVLCTVQLCQARLELAALLPQNLQPGLDIFRVNT